LKATTIIYSVTLIALTLSTPSATLAKQNIAKISATLQQKLTSATDKETLTVFVYFKDKGNNIADKLKAAKANLSAAALRRRIINLGENNVLDYDDIPIDPEYLNWLQSKVSKVRHPIRAINAVSVEATPTAINEILSSDFVAKVERVKSLKRPARDSNFVERMVPSNTRKTATFKSALLLDYGTSITQNQQINVPAVHELGYDGSGVVIAVFDSGFNRLSHESFAHLNILDTWDFVNNDSNVGDENDMGTGSHGTNTLSTIAGFSSGNLIGPAYAATFYLAKTENNQSETHVEEDNWCAAAEWADQNGAQIISSSLGYTDFDSGTDYSANDMDGETTIVTLCAEQAAANGIVVINSAGNSGIGSGENTIGAPSDGHSVLAIGAITNNGQRSSFSSVGPSADGRIKPDLVAMGSSVTVASASADNLYSSVDGTSFACPLTTGVAALVLQANPNLTAAKVRDVLRNTADGASSPDTLYGYGVVNALAAVNHAVAELTGNQSPIAEFEATTSSNLTVTFNQNSTDSDGSIVSYAWDFDDGQSSAEENPTHNYTNEGTYIVGLTVTDDGGLTSSYSRVIAFQSEESSSSGGGGSFGIAGLFGVALLLTRRKQLVAR
jgi:serine protease AprX